VRDLLLGREPSDYDVATDALPREVMQIFPETYAVGAQFGVVLVPISEAEPGPDRPAAGREESALGGRRHKASIEVATFRRDLGYSDGRHPDSVSFTRDPEEDVKRRDFTINGLLSDPIENRILDFVGGERDLQSGIIRAIGEAGERFREDKLRMMRAVRFAARFAWTIEEGTFRAICQLAPEIHAVSRERVRDELTRMLTEGRARRAFELLDQARLLAEVLPEIAAMKGVEQPPQYHPEGDVFTHTLLMLEQLPAACSATLAWGVLLHDVGKPPTFRRAPDRIRFDEHARVGARMAEEISRRLRFSRDETAQISALVGNHMRFADVEKMKPSTFKKFIRLPRFGEHLELHRLDCASSHRNLRLYEFTREQIRGLPPEAVDPAPLLSGDDLIAAGYAPGPQFKEILDAVEDAQLDGRLHSRREAIEFVGREFPPQARSNE